METSFEKLIEEINSFAKPEMATEELDKISAINKMASDLQEQNKALKDEITSLKEKLIDSIKYSGTSKQVDDVRPKQSMSFEEYAEKFIANRERK